MAWHRHRLHQQSSSGTLVTCPTPTDRYSSLLNWARASNTRGSRLQQQWSVFERLGVALVTGDGDMLDQYGRSRTTVLKRWSYALWGVDAGAEDNEVGNPRTNAWFDCLRADFDLEEATNGFNTKDPAEE